MEENKISNSTICVRNKPLRWVLLALDDHCSLKLWKFVSSSQTWHLTKQKSMTKMDGKVKIDIDTDKNSAVKVLHCSLQCRQICNSKPTSTHVYIGRSRLYTRVPVSHLYMYKHLLKQTEMGKGKWESFQMKGEIQVLKLCPSYSYYTKIFVPINIEGPVYTVAEL